MALANEVRNDKFTFLHVESLNRLVLLLNCVDKSVSTPLTTIIDKYITYLTKNDVNKELAKLYTSINSLFGMRKIIAFSGKHYESNNMFGLLKASYLHLLKQNIEKEMTYYSRIQVSYLVKKKVGGETGTDLRRTYFLH